MSSMHRAPPSFLAHIIWAVSTAIALPAMMAATRIRQITFDQVPQAPRVVTAGGGRAGRSSGIAPFLFRTFVLGVIFVMADERAGLDILYRAFGLDILPKTPAQLALRKHRALWREAKASGDETRIQETFFRLKREKFGLMGVKYQEEAVKTPWDTGKASELLDPRDVRVFFVLSEGSTSVVAKIYIAFNADPDEPGVREKVDRTTKWILTRQVESRMAEGRLEMPCKLERAYRDRTEGEHTLQWSRNEDGSHTLADAWDQRRTIFVEEDDMRPAE